MRTSVPAYGLGTMRRLAGSVRFLAISLIRMRSACTGGSDAEVTFLRVFRRCEKGRTRNSRREKVPLRRVLHSGIHSARGRRGVGGGRRSSVATLFDFVDRMNTREPTLCLSHRQSRQRHARQMPSGRT